MYVIRKKFRVEYSHRLMGSWSECCQQIHGHSAIIEIFFKGEDLNKDGMIIDFGQVKDRIGMWLISEFDHILILHKDDKLNEVLNMNDLDINKVDFNPTAENFTKYIYDYVKNIYPFLSKVRFHETETGYAEYYEER